jgi:hypothetical protein
MNSSLYHKRVREIMNQRGISEESARSFLGKKGAEARKRKAQATKEIKPEILEYWWNKD